MRSFRAVTFTEQVAEHIRRGILQGTFEKVAPGVHKLAAALGVHHTTVAEALQLLEKEGLLISQGPGRRRRIRIPENIAPISMRVGILPYEEGDRTTHYFLEMQHKLQDAGHSAGFVPKTLHQLGMDVERVARFIQDTDMDAWIIVAGSRGVLEWFADQPLPAFALFGRRRGVPIAGTGPDKLSAMQKAVERMLEIGHRRIVLLMREEHRKPRPGYLAQAFLDAMESHGLQTGPYNLPDWENTPKDFRRCLDSLFRHTPPSALIIDEAFLFNVAQQHLARNGILAPQHVSLMCADPDPFLKWSDPSIAYIRWDSRKVVQHVVQWAKHVSRGKEDRRQCFIKAEFIEGGTLGPVAVTRG